MATGDQVPSPSQPVTPEVNSQLLAIYRALRDEILQRIQIQHQLIAVAVIALGTILTVGFQSHQAAPLLVYPLLALFLAAAWAHNDRLIRLAGYYIRDHVEKRVGTQQIGWEHFVGPTRAGILGTEDFFASRGIFLGGALTTLVIGGSQIKVVDTAFGFFAGVPVLGLPTLDNVLFLLGGIGLVGTFLLLLRPSEKRLLAKTGTPLHI